MQLLLDLQLSEKKVVSLLLEIEATCPLINALVYSDCMHIIVRFFVSHKLDPPPRRLFCVKDIVGKKRESYIL